MFSQIPLYSRGRPLKNLIADWKKKYNVQSILTGDWDFTGNPPNIGVPIATKGLLYKAIIGYWYFANIGFDSDEEFIYRFNAIWQANERKYGQLFEEVYQNGYSSITKTRKLTITKSGEDTTSRTGEIRREEVHGGMDEYEKGVSTTSTQSTTNEGNKLARSTPNENLSVVGSANTTVADSGSDITKFGRTLEETETPNTVDKTEYGTVVSNDDKETSVMLTPEEISRILGVDVIKDFVLLFEKLFMEVL